MGTWWQDIGYGARLLKRNPSFAAVAVLTMALGIGATTGIFGVVNAVLLRPMHFKDVERLVMIWEVSTSRDLSVVSPATYLDWKNQSTSFEQMAIIDAGFPYSLMDVDEPTQPIGTRVSPEFFSILGVSPLLGRTFDAAEATKDGPPVVILGEGIWQRWYGADPGLIGRSITVANVVGEITQRTVVGIMPAGFRFPGGSELWLPYPVDTIKSTERGGWFARVVAKLKPGVTHAQAQAEMDVIAERLAQAYPETNRDSGVRVTSLHEHLVQNVRLSLYVLQGAALLVLLVAVVNVANLLLVRSASRGREMALRAVLGANRWRILRQLLVESLLLGLAGGALGLLGARVGVGAFGRLAAVFLPRAEQSSVDGRVLGFALVISIVSGLIFGLAPAVHALRTDLNGCLKEPGVMRGLGASRSGLMRYWLVSVEIALSLMLLAGAGLFLKSFILLGQTQAGFSPQNVLTVELGGIGRPISDELIERLSSLPDVLAVGGTNYLPFSGADCDNLTVKGGLPRSADEKRPVYQKIVTPDYFRAMGIPLLKGRGLTRQDVEGATPVIVVNEAFVKRLVGPIDPIGRQLADDKRHMIVGVVGDARDLTYGKESQPQVYYSSRQKPIMQAKLVIRTQSEPMRLAPTVREVIRATEKDRPISSMQTMEDRIESSIVPQRFQTALVGLFSVIALALAAVGVYGVVSYSVAQRVREFGIRMALGATNGDLLKAVLGQGLRLTLIGLAIGLAGGLAAARVLRSLLYDVSPTDPLTFGCVSLLLAGVAVVASYVPARRAAKIDPMVALRYE